MIRDGITRSKRFYSRAPDINGCKTAFQVMVSAARVMY
ncbi:hypothetical protein D1AOALGA4SA_9726 [Olavius algarvensis Delta 1 endosymbiont]|nr:hypothetical protein D1AOALGA4SA_9726 [Olavius algarvensis Delta 1 endosymbiont]